MTFTNPKTPKNKGAYQDADRILSQNSMSMLVLYLDRDKATRRPSTWHPWGLSKQLHQDTPSKWKWAVIMLATCS